MDRYLSIIKVIYQSSPCYYINMVSKYINSRNDFKRKHYHLRLRKRIRSRYVEILDKFRRNRTKKTSWRGFRRWMVGRRLRKGSNTVKWWDFKYTSTLSDIFSMVQPFFKKMSLRLRMRAYDSLLEERGISSYHPAKWAVFTRRIAEEKESLARVGIYFAQSLFAQTLGRNELVFPPPGGDYIWCNKKHVGWDDLSGTVYRYTGINYFECFPSDIGSCGTVEVKHGKKLSSSFFSLPDEVLGIKPIHNFSGKKQKRDRGPSRRPRVITDFDAGTCSRCRVLNGFLSKCSMPDCSDLILRSCTSKNCSGRNSKGNCVYGLGVIPVNYVSTLGFRDFYCRLREREMAGQYSPMDWYTIRQFFSGMHVGYMGGGRPGTTPSSVICVQSMEEYMQETFELGYLNF